MTYLELSVWINAMASLVILISALRLYQLHHAQMPVQTRAFFASIFAAAIWSLFEILAWRRAIPVGMTAFLVLLAVGWALRAFTPICLLPAVLAGSAPARSARAGHEDRPAFALRRDQRVA